MSIARFLVEHMGRFEDFKGHDFGAGMPASGRYRRMLKAFEPMKKRLDYPNFLSARQIIHLIEAGRA
jgi:uncharacterized protein YfbU (UPF0304 family)